MAAPDQSTRRAEAIATMAEHGIAVTEEGLRRARAELDEAAAKHSPDYWRRLRQRLGLPAKSE